MSLLGRWRKSEHQWVDESLSAYMDGQLSPSETARVEEHLRECEACAENLATLRQTVALLQELPTRQAPRSFAVRPASVRARRVVAPPAWGYGLLRGATALAALLLVLLIGGDIALRFVGAPMAYFAPAAPAHEVALAPSFEPGTAPAPAEEEAALGQTKATEPSSAEAPPANGEEAPPPAPASTEAADTFEASQEMASPAAREEGAPPAGTPTTPVPPSEAPPVEGEGVWAGEPVTATATLSMGTPGPTGEEYAISTVQPEAAATPTEITEERASVPPPTSTPPVLAMADESQREAEAQESGAEQREAEALPFSPLRLAELMAFALLIVLGAATALSAWLRRRSG